MKWFGRKPEFRVLEIEPAPALVLDAEGKKAIQTLQHHHGFNLLMRRLRLQRAALERKLREDRHTDIKEVEFIQSGIFWIDWLQQQVARETAVSQSRSSRPASNEEQDAFAAVDALLERVE